MGTSAGAKGYSLNRLALGHNVGRPMGQWHSHAGRRQTVGWENGCRCLVKVTAAFVHSEWSVGHTQSRTPKINSFLDRGLRGICLVRVGRYCSLWHWPLPLSSGGLVLWHQLRSSYLIPPLGGLMLVWTTVPLPHGHGQGGEQGNLEGRMMGETSCSFLSS